MSMKVDSGKTSSASSSYTEHLTNYPPSVSRQRVELLHAISSDPSLPPSAYLPIPAFFGSLWGEKAIDNVDDSFEFSGEGDEVILSDHVGGVQVGTVTLRVEKFANLFDGCRIGLLFDLNNIFLASLHKLYNV
jgi:hypothetical protein